jgi:hypothetical protein
MLPRPESTAELESCLDRSCFPLFIFSRGIARCSVVENRCQPLSRQAIRKNPVQIAAKEQLMIMFIMRASRLIVGEKSDFA